MKHTLLSIFSLAAFLLTFELNAQQTITQWDFNTITPGDVSTATPNIGSGTISLYGGTTTPTSGSTGVGSSDQSATNLAFQTTSYPAQSLLNQQAGIQLDLNTTGYFDIKLKFDLRLSNTASRWVQIQYTNNNISWQNFGQPIRMGGSADDNAGDTWFLENEIDFSSIAAVDNNPNFKVRIVSSFSANAFTLYNTGENFGPQAAYEPARNPSLGINSNYSAAGTMRYDMITLTGTDLSAQGPTISASPLALAPFTQALGSPSLEQTFTASAINLTGNLTITAPANYQVSLSSGTGFASSVQLTPSAGTVNATTIYVRLNAGSIGNHNGNIALTAAGATTINVALTGETTATPTPFITVLPNALNGFNQVIGSPSLEQSFTVSGGNLTANININAPTGFEVSLNSGTGFSSSTSLTPTAGTVLETTVYVRLNHNTAGAISGNITCSSTGATNELVALNGNVENPPAPFLAVSPNVLNDFTQNLGFPSPTQFTSVGGDNLTGDITIESTGNFFISTDPVNNFTQTLSLSPSNGFVDPVQIFVHLNASSVGNSTGTLTISTNGANDEVINLNGQTIASSGQLLYYWHFNTLETPEDVTTINADYSLVAGIVGKFDYTNPVAGQRDMDVYDIGSDLNLQLGEGSGKACRVRNPSTDRTLDFYVPTNDASGIRLSYAVQRSGSGMLENVISYSINGIDYITTDLPVNVAPISEIYELVTIDFSGIDEVNDNPNFRIRIAFQGNTVAINGNNRFDNITLVAENYVNIPEIPSIQVQIVPNPAKDFVAISSNVDLVSISLFDISGKMIMTTDKNTFSVQEMPKGVYIMLVETALGSIQEKLIVE